MAAEGADSPGFVALFENIDPRRELEDRLRHLANHDHLTGLANRRWMEARLEYVLASMAQGSALGVAVIDLDQFKLINDTYGHASGDELIVQVAERLRELTGNEGSVARFGGDEFVVLFPRAEASTVRSAVRSLHSALGGRIHLRETDVFLTASLGLALTEGGTISAAELLRSADMAMHKAKERGRGVIVEFGASSISRSSTPAPVSCGGSRAWPVGLGPTARQWNRASSSPSPKPRGSCTTSIVPCSRCHAPSLLRGSGPDASSGM